MRLTSRRIVLLVLGVVVLLFGGCVGSFLLWVAVSTDSAASEADQFLSLLILDDLHAAYKETSAELRTTQSEERFVAEVDRLGLSDYELTIWLDRTLERRGHNRFKGKMLTNWGEDDEFTVEVVKEDGEWRVLSFNDEARELIGPGAWFRQPPDDEEMLKLIYDTTAGFIAAIEKGSLRSFYDSASLAFRIEIPFSRFDTAFRSFIDEEIDISSVLGMKPVLDGPPLLESVRHGEVRSDTLMISGYYPVQPSPVPFKYTYFYAHPDWMLYRFLVKAPAEDALDPNQCLRWLRDNPGKSIEECFQEE